MTREPADELCFRFRSVDVDRLIGVLRLRAGSRSDLAVAVSDEPIDEQIEPIWGYFLADGDHDAADDAAEQVNSGAGEIVWLATPDGPRRAFVLDSPYRSRVEAAIAVRGAPAFWHVTTITTIRLTRPDGGPVLDLHLDRAVGGTGWPRYRVDRGGEQSHLVFAIEDHFGYELGWTTIPDYLWAIGLSDELAELGELRRLDTTGYLDSRDEARLIAAIALSREIVRSFEAAAAGAALVPDPAAFERMRARLMARAAREPQRPGDGGPDAERREAA